MTIQNPPTHRGPSLLELASQAQHLEALILKTYQQTEGEITPESEALEKELKALGDHLETKVDAVHHVMTHFKNRSEFFKEYGNNVLDAARAILAVEVRLKSMVKYIMEKQGRTELNGELVRFKLSKTAPSLDVDQEQLPPEYWEEKIVRTPDTTKIRADLKAGKEIPGARFNEGAFSLRSYMGGGK